MEAKQRCLDHCRPLRALRAYLLKLRFGNLRLQGQPQWQQPTANTSLRWRSGHVEAVRAGVQGLRKSKNLMVQYCIAARRIQNFFGAAQRAALQLNDEQLQGTQEDRPAGSKAVLAHLRRVFSPDPLICEAQSFSEFFSSQENNRHQGQQIMDFVMTFD